MITKADIDNHHAQTEKLHADVEAFIAQLVELVKDDKLSADLAIEITTLLQRMNNHHRDTLKTAIDLLGKTEDRVLAVLGQHGQTH